jgi:hypothetical protein
MADITGYNQGQVSDEGKVNWRGDQVSVTPGNQSVYDTSSVQLADLGSRKVVGDRVFRYALATGAIPAGNVAQAAPISLINVTAGTVNASGGKQFSFYFATSNAANVYAEGSLLCQSGTAANLGYTYRIKSHPVVATTSKGVLTLYDPLKLAVNVTDSWSIQANPYTGLTTNTAGTAAPVGVAPVVVASADYFWLQTWGPCAIKGSAVAAAGRALCAGATGQVQDMVVGTTADPRAILGYSMQILTASQYGMAFITIAP